jgi:hypothetical protein
MLLRLCAIATALIAVLASASTSQQLPGARAVEGARLMDAPVDTPPGVRHAPLKHDTTYRAICEPPNDSATVARQGCVLRDQRRLSVRRYVPPEPKPKSPTP